MTCTANCTTCWHTTKVLFKPRVRGLLEIEPDFNVIGQAGNVTDVVDRVLSLKPDVLLLDPEDAVAAEGEYFSPRRSGRSSGCQWLSLHHETILFAADMETQEIVEAIG